MIGGCTFAVRRFSHKRKLKDAYQAYDLKPEKFTLSPEFRDYDLPSAPDLSALIGQQSTPVVLPSVPIVEDDDDIPPDPDFDWMMDYMDKGSDDDDISPDPDFD